MSKKIVVLLSTFNGEDYIRTQIDSILNQKLSNCELYLYVRDDGSSDKTCEILKEYGDRIKITEGENKGYIASFLELVQYSKDQSFDYFSFADQDDRWDLDKLQIAIDMLDKEDNSNPVLYQSRSRTVDEELNYIGIPDPPSKPITVYNTIIQTISAGHTYVFNKALLSKIEFPIDASRIYGHDSFITNIAAIYGRIIFDNDAHTDYRQHGANQLGTSNVGMFSWIKSRLERLKRGHGKQYARQIEYIYELFGKQMDTEVVDEINRFLKSRKTFRSRLCYIVRTKLYRQETIGNIAFRLLYLLGGYSTEV